VQIFFASVDGKPIAYTNQTVFLIEIGKGPKGAYKTRFEITGNLGQACRLYRGINVGNGFKKRLFVPTFNKPMLARDFS
jgi:hypothetical protein